jgi:hypothetical protein
MSFCTPKQFLQRVDYRIVADLCQDADTPPSQAELLVDPIVQQSLNDAAGDIVIACVPAQRYSDLDLANISAALDSSGNPSPSASVLHRLNSILAMAHLYERREYPLEEIGKKLSGWMWALDLLEMLRNGNRVFDNAAQVNVGVDFTSALAGDVQLKTGTVSGGVNLMSGITRIFGILDNSPR